MFQSLLIIADDLNERDPKKDSTIILCQAALKQPIDLRVVTPKQLHLRDNTLYIDDQPAPAFEAYAIRIDPPVNSYYLHVCLLLKLGLPNSIPLTHPDALIGYNEKLLALEFPEYCLESIVSQDIDYLHAFIQKHSTVVAKPLWGFAGKGLCQIDNNTNSKSLLELVTYHGSTQVMLQPFLPKVAQGDKRIIVAFGEVFPFALNRIPASDEFRANMACGSRTEVIPLTDTERTDCKKIALCLQKKGIGLAGLDWIGGYLTEVNITSPTGLAQLSEATRNDVGQWVLERWQRPALTDS